MSEPRLLSENNLKKINGITYAINFYYYHIINLKKRSIKREKGI